MKLSQILPRALILALTLTFGLPMASAANRVSQFGPEAKEGYEEIDLFQAMNDGIVDVQFIAKNAKEANIIIKNMMDKPLAIKMPAAFVVVAATKVAAADSKAAAVVSAAAVVAADKAAAAAVKVASLTLLPKKLAR
jgi:hypothetical protein